jgi:hypothetical protein
MSSKTDVEYPDIPSILALVGGTLIVLFGLFLVTVSIVVLPHLNYTNFTPPRGYTGSSGALAGNSSMSSLIPASGRISPSLSNYMLILRFRP